MENLFLTPEQLAARWHISSTTLNQWRWNKRGPKHIKINGRVLYELQEVKKFEESKRHQESSTNKRHQQPSHHLNDLKKSS